MQLSVIIVNYNVKHFLEHCLLSVEAACTNIKYEIIVVDNNSTDGSQVFFKNKFSNVHFFWLEQNLGFAKANNYAIKQAKGQYVLFLNPDTIVGENTVTNCVRFLQQQQNCGAVGVRMIDGAGEFLPESKRNLPSPLSGFFKAMGLAKLFNTSTLFAAYYATKVAEKETKEVPVLAGAFMMLPKQALNQVKGFDEDFFMYGEDIDLSYRLTKAGLINFYIGSETILHFKGESMPRQSKQFANTFYDASLLFVKKHYSGKPLLSFFMQSFLTIAKKTVLAFAQTSKQHTQQQKFNALALGEQASMVKDKITSHNISIEIDAAANSEKQVDSYVLCNPKNEENITALEKYGSNKTCFLFDKKASSIIASNNKNYQGIVLE
jgi:GT2 family glycosyltransferase